jgi:hypothetical protein
MIMPKRDNNAPRLSERWQGRFLGFLVFRETFLFQRPTDRSPFCLISRREDSEIAISDINSLEIRRQ